MLNLALKAGGIAAGSLFGLNLVGKLFGNDPDFSMAWQLRMMSGQNSFSAFMATMFKDGIGKMFLGSRSASAAMNRGMMGAHLYGSSSVGNPYSMGTLPYAPMAFGTSMWA